MTSDVMVLRRRSPESWGMTSTHSTHSTDHTHPTSAARRPGVTMPLAGAFLLADAATTGVNGLAYALAGGWLADWFGAPEALVRSLGLLLVVIAVGVALLARRAPIPRRGVAALACVNVLWVLASLAYALVGGLTTVGVVWTVLQAVVVGVFAAGQVWLARRG